MENIVERPHKTTFNRLKMRKINLPEVYSNFFVDCDRRQVRNIMLQGGRRSRKTWSTFEKLYAMGCFIGGMTILVCTYQFPTLQLTIQDFEECIGAKVSGSLRHGYHARTDGNTLWMFNHFDSRSKAQGTKCDVLFVNEALQMPEPVVRTLLMGCRWQAYYNYNPTDKGWVQDMDNSALLKTTFKDNPYLTDAQLQEFASIKERAMRPTATRWDKYQYRVFYKGEFDQFVGKVFSALYKCSVRDYEQIPAQESYGIDFGFATDGDPTTLIGCKMFGNDLYFRQYIYEQGLTSDVELGTRILANGLTYATPIAGDYGGMGKGRIQTLRTANNGKWSGDLAKGFAIYNCIKTGILDGLSQLLTADHIYICEGSDQLRSEMEQYSISDSGTPEGADHGIDAARYAYNYAKRNYI